MGSPLPELEDLEHRSELEYSKEKRDELTDRILGHGYNVMLYQNQDGECLTIFIDNRRFQQR